MRKKFERGEPVIANGRFGIVSDVNYGRTYPEIAVDHVLSDSATTVTTIYPEHQVLLAWDKVAGGVENVTKETPRDFQVGEIVVVNGNKGKVWEVSGRGSDDYRVSVLFDHGGMITFGQKSIGVISKCDDQAGSITDTVDHPPHYSSLVPEPIDVITSWGLDFCLGNAVKYISQWEAKGGVEDLQEALWYLQRKLEMVEREEDDDSAEGF